MAEKLNVVTPDTGDATTDYPDGTYLNEGSSEPGTPILAGMMNSFYYFFSRMMSEAGIEFNGNADNMTSSQFFTAIKTLYDNAVASEASTRASADSGLSYRATALEGKVGQSLNTTDNPTFWNGIKTASGFAGGSGASTASGGAAGNGASGFSGGAVGSGAEETLGGGSVGQGAKASMGGAVGRAAEVSSGGAIGNGARATNGFAGGSGASAIYSGSSALGAGAQATASNQIKLGTSSETVLLGNGDAVTSDERDKTDIADNDLGLEFLQKIVTKKFRKNPRELYYIRDDKGKVKKDENNNLVYDEKAHEAGEKKGKRFHRGMIAQELEASVDNMNFSGVKHFTYNDKNNNDEYAIDYGQFIPICIKAIQEQQEQIEELKQRLTKLQ